MLHAMRREWDMVFAPGGAEALDIVAAEPPDVIVSDTQMPGMDGVELLTQVKRRHPQIVRISLSGECSAKTVLHSVNVVHQYQAKPCEPGALKDLLARVAGLSDLLANEQLRERVSSMSCIHSLPELRARLAEQLESPGASAAQAGRILARDLGLSAKVMQFVSSAFFAEPVRTLTPAEAADFLGLDTLKALALSVGAFADFSPESLAAAPLERITEHSLLVAECARALAVAEGFSPETTQQAFLGGLFHDIGKAVLAQELPRQYAAARALAQRERLAEQEAEHHALGATHSQVGAFLMGLWGLPPAVVEALAFHHAPSASGTTQPNVLTVVHAANAIVHRMHSGGSGAAAAAQMDEAYLAELGLTARAPAWNELCQAAVNKETANV